MAEEAGSLSFRYAGLSRLPDSIAPTRGVRRLDLTGNSLAEVPEPIRGMLDLESLRLDDNQLACLPPWISDLAQLRELHLDGNQLTDVPSSIEGLPHLETLHLRRNRLRSVPEALSRVPGLRDRQGVQAGHGLRCRGDLRRPRLPRRDELRRDPDAHPDRSGRHLQFVGAVRVGHDLSG